jgi:hypothetical protein
VLYFFNSVDEIDLLDAASTGFVPVSQDVSQVADLQLLQFDCIDEL